MNTQPEMVGKLANEGAGVPSHSSADASRGPRVRRACRGEPDVGLRGPRRSGGSLGFTLIELMVVVVVIGILVAVAMPNFSNMQRRANEGSVKSNMHTVQMAVEDFGLLNDGNYPVTGLTALPDGRILSQVCPTGNFPKNPYNGLPSAVRFNANPSSGVRGELALNPATTGHYLIKGNGSDGDTLALTLTSGE